MKLFTKIVIPFSLTMLMYSSVSAATFDKALWIPYWRKTEGASSTLANLNVVTQISPFAFELQPDGTIKDALRMGQEPWTTLIKEARKKKIKIYPSILSYPSTLTEKKAVYDLLSNKKRRDAHIKEIVALVKKHNVDGIDIDYEAKLAEIKPHFSIFLKDLSIALAKEKKQLICTVEPRTPPDSRYATTSKQILSKVEYANDYKAIGRWCHQVRIMAYDQSTDDAKLVNKNKLVGKMYAPVADIEWVKKVVTVALWDIPARKIIVGVPTYGSKYEIITTATTTRLVRIGSMNFNYADDLAKTLKITPTRNSAGELSYVYGTTTGVNGEDLGGYKQYLIWYSDARAISDKVRLAKLYKLGGVSVFKVDGGQDPELWKVLK